MCNLLILLLHHASLRAHLKRTPAPCVSIKYINKINTFHERGKLLTSIQNIEWRQVL